VPTARGMTADDAPTVLSGGPRGRQPIYKPAQPGQPVGVVIGQIPSIGSHLEPLDTVRLVLAKPLHGVVPSVVGLQPDTALQKLAGRGLKAVVGGLLADGSRTQRVMSQQPRAGVAAAPGMTVTLTVAG